MIIRVHKAGSSFGQSFKGLAAYLLHDKGKVESSERVAWTETRNLATENPDTAWRVMAATAMDADRLKANAGVKNTGRKSTASVMHFALSWAEDEAPSRKEMVAAADAILANLGKDNRKKGDSGRSQFADEHQSLIVCHTDSGNPHVHLMVNRVHPKHGVMLPSSNDFLKASKFGLEYEKKTGHIRCANRAINWQARDRGEFVRDTKSKPRNIYEQEKQAANTNTPDFKHAADEQRGKDAALAKKGRDLKKRHVQQMDTLASSYREEVSKLDADTKKAVSIAKQKVRDEFRPQWEYRFHEKVAEMRRFEIDEDKFLGRVKNFSRSLDFKAFLNADNRRNAIKQTFDALSSSGGRQQALKRKQEAKDATLYNRQQEAEKAAALSALEKKKRKQAVSRDRFLAKRSELLLAQNMERAALKTEWKTRNAQRGKAYKIGGQELASGSGLTPEKQAKLATAFETMKRLEKYNRALRGNDLDRGGDHSKGRGR